VDGVVHGTKLSELAFSGFELALLLMRKVVFELEVERSVVDTLVLDVLSRVELSPPLLGSLFHLSHYFLMLFSLLSLSLLTDLSSFLLLFELHVDASLFESFEPPLSLSPLSS
jgi:hypothetical protein